MTTEREVLTIHLEGMPAAGGDMQLSSFVDKLDIFRTLIQESDKTVKGSDEKPLDFLVVNLSHNSPAAISVSSIDKQNRAAQAFDFLLSTLSEINADSYEPDRFSYPLLEKLEKLTIGFKERFSSLWFSRNGAPVAAITEETRQKVKNLLLKNILSTGAVKGRIERYDGHAEEKYFYVYPTLGGKVKCIFPEELKDQASAAVEHNVTVAGLLKFREGDFFPYEMNVSSIEMHPNDSDLPTLTGLLGAAPSATDKKLSTEFIRENRDDWH